MLQHHKILWWIHGTPEVKSLTKPKTPHGMPLMGCLVLMPIGSYEGGLKLRLHSHKATLVSWLGDLQSACSLQLHKCTWKTDLALGNTFYIKHVQHGKKDLWIRKMFDMRADFHQCLYLPMPMCIYNVWCICKCIIWHICTLIALPCCMIKLL